MLRRVATTSGFLAAASLSSSTSSASSSSSSSGALMTLQRAVHLPGWKTQQSTKDIRSREQREVDRKARQIEKLPRPEALHDFQYPYEKTVLADHMFQSPVFENELDTPHLFHPTPPADFFLYWNVADFERTDYPTVPQRDHRLLIPSAGNEEWSQHVVTARAYNHKHQITPQFVPNVSYEANLAVTFSGTYGLKGRKDPDTGALAPPPPPVTSMTKQNFWFTAHCGNFIELCELQQAPSIFLTTEKEQDDAYYTLIIASPDFPYRTAPSTTQSNSGFYLQYMVSNLRGGHKHDVKSGDVVVGYTPPLPTEDAGTARHLCMLFRQHAKIDNLPKTPYTANSDKFSFEERRNFQLHSTTRHSGLADLKRVEDVLPADPVCVTMFQTAWDIQVQEFYESISLPEPAFALDEELEAILKFNATPSGELRVRSRHEPDGSVVMGKKARQWSKFQDTNMMDGSMRTLWSRKTSLGKNKKKIVTPY